MSDFILPSKVLPALKRIWIHYDTKNIKVYKDIIESCHMRVAEAVDMDNWNGGTYGHDVILYLPESKIKLIDLDEQSKICERIKNDINKAIPAVDNEWIRSVLIEFIDETNPNYQKSIPFSRNPTTAPEDVGIWKNNYLRLFVTHSSKQKSKALELAEELDSYGVACFVAHHTIKPMKEWQSEILNGLKTMEILLVFLTDDFHDSEWTNQEVGFALGKNIPILCVKIENCDPTGFLATKQALDGANESANSLAAKIHKALIGELGQDNRHRDIMIGAFINSSSFTNAIDNLKRLRDSVEYLSDKEFKSIAEAYSQNDQLYNCSGIHTKGNWFLRYLEKATGKILKIANREIVEENDDLVF